MKLRAGARRDLLGISSRSVNVDSGQPKQAEFQLQFSVSCVEFYYYDLITSLTPDLQKYLDEHPAQQSQGNSVAVNIPVKAGQLVGKIGGQTLDWAVWDFNKTLTGYVVPEHYQDDFPRIHLVSPFDNMTDEPKQALLPKLARGAPPVEGKVDYDIDGKLIGGWFLEGSGSYGGHIKATAATGRGTWLLSLIIMTRLLWAYRLAHTARARKPSLPYRAMRLTPRPLA